MLGLGSSVVGGTRSDDIISSATVVGASFDNSIPAGSGKSLSFDGVNDYLNLNSNFLNVFRNSFTISFWVELADGQPSTKEIMTGFIHSNYTTHKNEFRIENGDDGVLAAYIRMDNVSAYTFTNSAVFTDGAQDWKQITLTFTKNSGSVSTLALYLNGSAITTGVGIPAQNITESNHSNFEMNANLFVGAQGDDFPGGSGTGGEHVNANIDDYAIWSTALDADAVTAIYNSGTPIDLTSNSGDYDNSGNLEAYYRMNEGSGTTVANSA